MRRYCKLWITICLMLIFLLVSCNVDVQPVIISSVTSIDLETGEVGLTSLSARIVKKDYEDELLDNIRFITLPKKTKDKKTITVVGSNAFASQHYIEKISIPNSYLKTNYLAFDDCHFLHTVEFGSGINAIYTINGDSPSTNKLTLIILKSEVPPLIRINENIKTFKNINSNLRFLVPINSLNDYRNDSNWQLYSDRIFADIEQNYYYEDDNRIIYRSEAKEVLLYVPNEISGDFVVPNSVEEIAESAFAHCTELDSVTIGNNVQIIGKWAFYGCEGLVIHSSLTEKPEGYNQDWVTDSQTVMWA